MKRILIPLLLLSACDASTPPPPTPVVEQPSSGAFEMQMESMKKAQAVEGQMQDAAEAQRKQIDEATKP